MENANLLWEGGPENSKRLAQVEQLRSWVEDEANAGRAMYIYCSGGHGRAGTVAVGLSCRPPYVLFSISVRPSQLPLRTTAHPLSTGSVDVRRDAVPLFLKRRCDRALRRLRSHATSHTAQLLHTKYAERLGASLSVRPNPRWALACLARWPGAPRTALLFSTIRSLHVPG